MRSDMAKVIVERPRGGHTMKNEQTRELRRNKKKSIEAHLIESFDEIEDDPQGEDTQEIIASSVCRAPIKPRRAEGAHRYYSRKELNENLRPLERFLYSRVGKQWDTVYSELCSRVNKNNAVQAHVLEHVNWYVDTPADNNFSLVETEYGIRPYRMGSPSTGLYVDQHGYLRDARRLVFPERISRKESIYAEWKDCYDVTREIDGCDKVYDNVLFCRDHQDNWWFIRTKTIKSGSWAGIPMRMRKWEPGDAEIIDGALDTHLIMGKFSYDVESRFCSRWRGGYKSDNLNAWTSTGVFPVQMQQASKQEISDILFFLKKKVKPKSKEEK